MLHLNLTFCAFNSQSNIACKFLVGTVRNGSCFLHCGHFWQRLMQDAHAMNVQLAGQATGSTKNP